jgi:hypothetical protein
MTRHLFHTYSTIALCFFAGGKGVEKVQKRTFIDSGKVMKYFMFIH